MPRPRPEAILAAVRRLRNGVANASLVLAVPLFVLLAALAVPSVFAGPPPNAADRIDGICSALHGDVVMDGLAAFARNNGLTRDELSAAMVEAIERRDKRARDPIRKMETSWLGTFGGTNALPTLRRMALDPNDACGRHAIGAYYQLVGRTPETLSWAEAFLLDPENDAGERRKQFLGVFRHALGWDGLPAPERAALGRVLLRTTAVEDGNPNWTDEVLCRAFPDYVGSAERRARLEAALARIPPSPAQRTDSAPDGLALLRASFSNALATAVATNPAPFEIPVPRSPPAPRVLPDEFVLPGNPAGAEAMKSWPQAPRPRVTRPKRRDGACTPPRESSARGTAPPLYRTGIFRLRLRLISCRITPRHAHCIDAMRKERSVDLKSKATKASSGRSSGRLRSVSTRRHVRAVGQAQVVASDLSFANDTGKRIRPRTILVFDFFFFCGRVETSEGFRQAEMIGDPSEALTFKTGVQPCQ